MSVSSEKMCSGSSGKVKCPESRSTSSQVEHEGGGVSRRSQVKY